MGGSIHPDSRPHSAVTSTRHVLVLTPPALPCTQATVKRVGRWIDFEHDYKTMNLTFMETVWWVFGQLHEKGLVYRGFKVMPYSCACNTPLSNFEVQQNYKTVDDPAVICAFPLKEEPGVNFIAWTTTPWTLPSNLALCVNPTYAPRRVWLDAAPPDGGAIS